MEVPETTTATLSGKIRVVLCTDGVFPEAMGGMQRHSRLLAEHLARTGLVDLTVLHPHDKDVFGSELGIREIRIRPIDTSRLYLRELWRYSGRVAAELEALAPEVIMSQGFCVWKNIHRFSDRLVLHPHGLEMFQGITTRERIMGAPFRLVLRYLIRRSRNVVSLGGKLTTILRGLAQGSPSTVVTLPNAVELPLAHVPYVPNDPLRLLFVGRFAFNKGLDLLMSVARRLEREGRGEAIRFELAGDGPLMLSYKAMGLPSNVQLLGRVDDDRLFELYSECDAFVLPTRFEGMPTVVLEAMARSRPIIVSDVGATAELVDGHNGYLIPKGDADALHATIMAFHDLSVERRTTMGAASRDRVQQRFSWPAVSAGFVDLFRSIAERVRA